MLGSKQMLSSKQMLGSKQMSNFEWIRKWIFKWISLLLNILLWPIQVKQKLRDPKCHSADQKSLLSMRLLGFEHKESCFALQLTGNDMEKAVNLLLQLDK